MPTFAHFCSPVGQKSNAHNSRARIFTKFTKFPKKRIWHWWKTLSLPRKILQWAMPDPELPMPKCPCPNAHARKMCAFPFTTCVGRYYTLQFLVRNKESRNLMTRNFSQEKQGVDHNKIKDFGNTYMKLVLE